MTPDKGRDQVAFPRELQESAIAARKDSAAPPERWMCVVTRREIIAQAVGKIVHVRSVSLTYLHSGLPTINMVEFDRTHLEQRRAFLINERFYSICSLYSPMCILYLSGLDVNIP
jgi:hypothetical protein